MIMGNRFRPEDLPDLPHARQLKAGFPWLTFDGELEPEFRQSVLDEHLRHIRINLCLAVTITLAFAALEAVVLGRELNRIPSMIHMLVMVPLLMLSFAASFSVRRHRLYSPFAFIVATLLGLSVAAIQIIVSLGGTAILFPCLEPESTRQEPRRRPQSEVASIFRATICAT